MSSDIKYLTPSFKRAFDYANSIKERGDKYHKILSLKIEFVEDSERDCANFYLVKLVYLSLLTGQSFVEQGKFYDD